MSIWYSKSRESLAHVQADELRMKAQGSIVGLAVAIMVSTRLWLRGAISPSRDTALIRRLVVYVRACAPPEPPLSVATDGLITYVKAFRSKCYTGRVGAPRLIAWPEVAIGKVLRRYKLRRVVDVERRLEQASFSQLRSSKHGPYRAIERDFPSEAGGIGEA